VCAKRGFRATAPDLQRDDHDWLLRLGPHERIAVVDGMDVWEVRPN
jgi:hypothetical protein